MLPLLRPSMLISSKHSLSHTHTHTHHTRREKRQCVVVKTVCSHRGERGECYYTHTQTNGLGQSGGLGRIKSDEATGVFSE